jgi:hypothetical protein
MSLLQEAIRKAERARDEAQPQPRRPELSAVPLEIVPDPEPSAQPLALEPTPLVEASSARAPSQPDTVAAEGLSAPDPKLAFRISLAAAGIAAVAAAVLFLDPGATGSNGRKAQFAACRYGGAGGGAELRLSPRVQSGDSDIAWAACRALPAELPRSRADRADGNCSSGSA